MKFKDTTEGLRWLEQFATEDQELAEMLLDRLIPIPQAEFNRAINEEVQAVADLSKGVVALYAVREIKIVPTPKASKAEAKSEVGAAQKPKLSPYFKNKRDRPTIIEKGKEVGSEGAMATLITDLCRATPALLNHPPIATLRKKHCRDIVFLDDIIGSGKRILNFIKAFLADSSLRSWRSLEWMNIHIVVFAASERGQKFILDGLRTRRGTQPPRKVRFYYQKRPYIVDAKKGDALAEKLRSLCVRYAKVAKAPVFYREGYRGAMNSLVFEQGCPNTVPAILWYGAPPLWTPLFPNRTIPSAFKRFFGPGGFTSPQPQASAFLAATDPAALRRLTHEDGLLLLYLLAALRKRIRSETILAHMIDVSPVKCGELLATARGVGFVDEVNVLTNAGLKELRHAEKAGKVAEKPVAKEGDLYFPSSLR